MFLTTSGFVSSALGSPPNILNESFDGPSPTRATACGVKTIEHRIAEQQKVYHRDDVCSEFHRRHCRRLGYVTRAVFVFRRSMHFSIRTVDRHELFATSSLVRRPRPHDRRHCYQLRKTTTAATEIVESSIVNDADDQNTIRRATTV
jgi:hypothetical protein